MIWCESGSRIFSNCGSGSGSGSRSRVLMTKNWKTFTAEKKFLFFWSKLAIYFSLGLHKERPSFRRSLQHSNKVIQHFKHENSLFFSIFVVHFCPPGSGSGSAFWMQIRFQQLKIMRFRTRNPAYRLMEMLNCKVKTGQKCRHDKKKWKWRGLNKEDANN